MFPSRFTNFVPFENKIIDVELFVKPSLDYLLVDMKLFFGFIFFLF